MTGFRLSQFIGEEVVIEGITIVETGTVRIARDDGNSFPYLYEVRIKLLIKSKTILLLRFEPGRFVQIHITSMRESTIADALFTQIKVGIIRLKYFNQHIFSYP